MTKAERRMAGWTAMNLEFLADGSQDCPLIRLYGFVPAEAERLLDGINRLASHSIDHLAVHELEGVEAIAGCRLTLVLRSWDQDIVQIGPDEFECALTGETWDNVAALIEPFAKGSGGFQWLNQGPGEANLLISPNGYW